MRGEAAPAPPPCVALCVSSVCNLPLLRFLPGVVEKGLAGFRDEPEKKEDSVIVVFATTTTREGRRKSTLVFVHLDRSRLLSI